MGLLLWLGMLVILVVDIAAIVDVVRRPDLGAGAKTLWVVLILLLPVIGLVAYVIARPSVVEGREDPDQARRAAGEAAAERARDRATEEGLGDYR